VPQPCVIFVNERQAQRVLHQHIHCVGHQEHVTLGPTLVVVQVHEDVEQHKQETNHCVGERDEPNVEQVREYIKPSPKAQVVVVFLLLFLLFLLLFLSLFLLSFFLIPLFLEFVLLLLLLPKLLLLFLVFSKSFSFLLLLLLP